MREFERDHYASVLAGMGVPRDRPVPIDDFAAAAGIARSHAERVRSRMRKIGAWPWPDSRSGHGCRFADEQILEAAERVDGRAELVASRVGCCIKTVRKARGRLRDAGRWPWPNSTKHSAHLAVY